MAMPADSTVFPLSLIRLFMLSIINKFLKMHSLKRREREKKGLAARIKRDSQAEHGSAASLQFWGIDAYWICTFTPDDAVLVLSALLSL